ncbi:hypothetical protein VZT92_002231 [Zoarces viviparus]|uniref:Uncharacterized protein n=1 Tax=Zoarces viviparus TaxID=48416 RepID=A0AAW1FY10_ZOAVI
MTSTAQAGSARPMKPSGLAAGIPPQCGRRRCAAFLKAQTKKNKAEREGKRGRDICREREQSRKRDVKGQSGREKSQPGQRRCLHVHPPHQLRERTAAGPLGKL